MRYFIDFESFSDALLDSTLVVGGVLSIVMAVVLLMRSFVTNYMTYARACLLSAIAYVVFGLGYLLHVEFHFRLFFPAAYVAVCISYLHIGGALLGLSHISILAPDYFKAWRVVRDVVCVLLSLACLWTPFVLQHCWGIEVGEPFMRAAGTWWHALTLTPFFLHCGFLALEIYIIYYKVRRDATKLSAPLIDHFVRWLLFNCHYIVFVGINSAAVVLLWGEIPEAMVALMVVAIAGFFWMFKNIICYSYDIDSAYPTIEDVTLNK